MFFNVVCISWTIKVIDIIDAWCNLEDYTAEVSLKTDNFGYDINKQQNNNMSLEER
jgi:hypothetical protein